MSDAFLEALRAVYSMFYDGSGFNNWLTSLPGYSSDWSDLDLYNAVIEKEPDWAEALSDWVLRPSWDHGPVNP